MTEILHKTALELAGLSYLVTRGRFLELTDKIPVDLLDEEKGAMVLGHLKGLSTDYHNMVNDIIATIEENQVDPFLNPRTLAEKIARRVTDRHSRERWSI